jgi:hypothetical protein
MTWITQHLRLPALLALGVGIAWAGISGTQNETTTGTHGRSKQSPGESLGQKEGPARRGVTIRKAVRIELKLSPDESSLGRVAFHALAPDGSSLVCSLYIRRSPNRDDYRTFALDAATGKKIMGLGEGVRAVTYSPDSSRVAVVEGSGMSLVDVRKRKLIVRAFEGCKWPGQPVFSPDGKSLAAQQRDPKLEREGVQLWDARNGKKLQWVGGTYGFVNRVSFSRDGTALATEQTERRQNGGRGHPTFTVRIRLWDVQSGKECGSVGEDWFDAGDRFHPRSKFREVGAEGGGFIIRRSPCGQLILFPPFPSHHLTAAVKNKRVIQLRNLLTGEDLQQFTYDEHGCDLHAAEVSADGRKMLAMGANYSWQKTNLVVFHVWDMPASSCGVRSSTIQLTDKERERLWESLAQTNLGEAARAASILAAEKKIVPWLSKRLKPAPKTDPRRLQLLIKQLGAEQYALRQQAEKSLEELGESAVPMLCKTERDAGLPPEVVTRCRRVLQHLAKQGQNPSAETLRTLWGGHILEHLSSPAAHALLRRLAKGEPTAWVTREVNASLRRLLKPLP